MKEFLNPKEVAGMFYISIPTAKAKEINFYRIGMSVRIREEDFNKYLQENKINVIELSGLS